MEKILDPVQILFRKDPFCEGGREFQVPVDVLFLDDGADRFRVLRLELCSLPDWLAENGLSLYGAALSPEAEDIRSVELSRCAVAVGSEGRGLSRELLDMCRGQIVIPMESGSESLNAAVAASVIMWEMYRR